MQNETQNGRSETSKLADGQTGNRPTARRYWIGLLLCAPMLGAGCASGRPPLVRTETVEVRVPVKPEIPAATLEPCFPESRLPIDRDPTVGEVEEWAEDLSVALEKCNADKESLRRALE